MAKVYAERWEIVRSLRPGGQAETFLVRDLSADEPKESVLKRLRNIERHARFAQEISTLKKLSHPGIVRLLDAHLDETQPFLVMEYCRAGSMEDHPTRWQGNPVRALGFVATICDALQCAHGAGVIHRDIKPANVLLHTDDGDAVLADFGIAFVMDGERHTLTDEAVGARKFTAPELADGRAEEILPSTDIYSLGKLLFWMLAGGRVFDREQHRSPAWDITKQPGARPELEHINRLLDQMIALDPKKRFADATAAGQAIRQTMEYLNKDVRVLGEDLVQPCAFCKQGSYASVRMDQSNDVHNFGLNRISGSEWRALVCRKCGNLQLFRVDHTESKQWWGPKGGTPPSRG